MCPSLRAGCSVLWQLSTPIVPMLTSRLRAAGSQAYVLRPGLIHPGAVSAQVVPSTPRASPPCALLLPMAKRAGCFDLTDEEMKDQSKIVGFASRVPQVLKTGDTFVDDERRMCRGGLVRVISQLWRNPEVVMQCTNWVDNRVASLKSRGTGVDFETLTTLGKLDESWLATFFQVHFGISHNLMESASGADRESMTQLLTFATAASPNLKLGERCKNKRVLELALLERMRALGPRLKPLSEKGASICRKDGSHIIDWGSHGVYAIEFDKAGFAAAFLHRPTGDKVKTAEHVRVSRKFMLEQNWCEHSAAVVLKPVKLVLADLFEAQTGPHKTKHMTGGSKEWENIVTAIVARVTAEASSSVGSAPQKRFREEQKTEAKRRNMEKAQARLEEKKTELTNRRRIQLDV